MSVIYAIFIKKHNQKLYSENVTSISFLFRRNIREVIKAVIDEFEKSSQLDPFGVGTYNDLSVWYQKTVDSLQLVFTTSEMTQHYAIKLMRYMSSNVYKQSDLDKLMSHPPEVDKIDIIQKELNETIVVARKTLEDVLSRGTQLEDVLIKSEKLSADTEKFLRRSKDLNKCCTIL